MQENYICDNSWLCRFSWPSAKSIKSTSRVSRRLENKDPPFTYTHAPIKLLYEFAFALQILLPKQIKEDKMSTGRLPKHVWIGTLWNISTITIDARRDLPDKVAKSKNKNCDSSKLYHICQIRVEFLNIIPKHRSLKCVSDRDPWARKGVD